MGADDVKPAERCLFSADSVSGMVQTYISAIAVVAAAVLADYPGSPLSWAKLIAARQYLPL